MPCVNAKTYKTSQCGEHTRQRSFVGRRGSLSLAPQLLPRRGDVLERRLEEVKRERLPHNSVVFHTGQVQNLNPVRFPERQQDMRGQ